MKKNVNKNVLFIGYYAPDKVFNSIVRNGINNMSAARQVLEENLLKGISSIEDIELNAVSYIPSNKQINISKSSKIGDLEIIHFPIIKGSLLSWIRNSLKFYSYLKSSTKLETSVIMYAVNPVFMIPLMILKPFRKYKLTTICSEVPNYRRYKKGVGSSIKKAILSFFNSKFDKYVFLTKSMSEVVNIGNKPYIVMEGIASETQYIADKEPRKNIVMYAGGLHSDNKVDVLIQAAIQNKNIEECVICGSGPQEGELKKLAAGNSKVKFLGRLSHENVLQLERQAKILVNLRDKNNILTKYSFPSKLMEYLSSGAWVISTKLDGIPEEYFDYIEPLEQNDVRNLSDLFDKLLTLSEDSRESHAINSVNFLRECKSIDFQAKRLIGFILE
ncbi:glycosyltransferase [Butyricimonas faecihominis]|jgi:glycosyltransferase involved in cell wall biosynthesis